MGILNAPKKLTPTEIKAKLFSFHNSAHHLHLETASYAEHKALDTLYNDLVGIKDEVIEILQGYLGRNLGTVNLDPLPPYSSAAPQQLVREIGRFAEQLIQYGENENMPDIENKAQELSGLAAQTKYMLTLK